VNQNHHIGNQIEHTGLLFHKVDYSMYYLRSKMFYTDINYALQFLIILKLLLILKPPLQWVLGVLSLRVKQPGYEVKVKNDAALLPLPHMSSCSGAYLIKHRDKFTFTTNF
jgi:hypothetical protein